ncbi:hypothetical protein M9458_044713, partial [Cirrhinus mrigala]
MNWGSPPVPFFPEVHEELVRTWRAPHSSRPCPSSSPLASLDGGAARGYEAVPQVERAVAVHLCLRGAATWRDRPYLPSKACKFSSALAGRTYHTAGQAATALHAMATLQVYQAKVLKHLHEKGSDQGAMEELPWFPWSGDVHHSGPGATPMADPGPDGRRRQITGGLFGDTVEDFAQQFLVVQKQTESIKHILPRRDIPTTSAGPPPLPAHRRGPPPAAAKKQPALSPAEVHDARLAARRRAARGRGVPPAFQGPVTRKRSAKRPCRQPGGGGNRSLGDDNINVPTPGGGPGAAVYSDAAVGLRPAVST